MTDPAAGPVTISTSCACGWTTTGDVDSVVEATADHAFRIHNMPATREQILERAVRVPDAPTEPDGTPA
jgi:predicted small metal-binding protein